MEKHQSDNIIIIKNLPKEINSHRLTLYFQGFCSCRAEDIRVDVDENSRIAYISFGNARDFFLVNSQPAKKGHVIDGKLVYIDKTNEISVGKECHGARANLPAEDLRTRDHHHVPGRNSTHCQCRKVYFVGIEDRISDLRIREYFEKFGELTPDGGCGGSPMCEGFWCRHRSSGPSFRFPHMFGEASFKQAIAMENVLRTNTHVLDGCKFGVRPATNSSAYQRMSSEQSKPSYAVPKLQIDRIRLVMRHSQLTLTQIENYFRDYGRVLGSKIIEDEVDDIVHIDFDHSSLSCPLTKLHTSHRIYGKNVLCTSIFRDFQPAVVSNDPQGGLDTASGDLCSNSSKQNGIPDADSGHELYSSRSTVYVDDLGDQESAGVDLCSNCSEQNRISDTDSGHALNYSRSNVYVDDLGPSTVNKPVKDMYRHSNREKHVYLYRVCQGSPMFFELANKYNVELITALVPGEMFLKGSLEGVKALKGEFDKLCNSLYQRKCMLCEPGFVTFSVTTSGKEKIDKIVRKHDGVLHAVSDMCTSFSTFGINLFVAYPMPKFQPADSKVVWVFPCDAEWKYEPYLYDMDEAISKRIADSLVGSLKPWNFTPPAPTKYLISRNVRLFSSWNYGSSEPHEIGKEDGFGDVVHFRNNVEAADVPGMFEEFIQKIVGESKDSPVVFCIPVEFLFDLTEQTELLRDLLNSLISNVNYPGASFWLFARDQLCYNRVKVAAARLIQKQLVSDSSWLNLQNYVPDHLAEKQINCDAYNDASFLDSFTLTGVTGKLSVTVKIGSIVEQKADALVNSVGGHLRAGGAIFRSFKDAGGDSYWRECNNIRNKLNPVTGVAITGPGQDNLARKCRYVIHVCNNDKQLTWIRRIQNALQLADDNKCKSIAFPALGAGENDGDIAKYFAVAIKNFTPCNLLAVGVILHDNRLLLDFQRSLRIFPGNQALMRINQAYDDLYNADLLVCGAKENVGITFTGLSMSEVDAAVEDIVQLERSLVKEFDLGSQFVSLYSLSLLPTLQLISLEKEVSMQISMSKKMIRVKSIDDRSREFKYALNKSMEEFKVSMGLSGLQASWFYGNGRMDWALFSREVGKAIEKAMVRQKQTYLLRNPENSTEMIQIRLNDEIGGMDQKSRCYLVESDCPVLEYQLSRMSDVGIVQNHWTSTWKTSPRRVPVGFDSPEFMNVYSMVERHSKMTNYQITGIDRIENVGLYALHQHLKGLNTRKYSMMEEIGYFACKPSDVMNIVKSGILPVSDVYQVDHYVPFYKSKTVIQVRISYSKLVELDSVDDGPVAWVDNMNNPTFYRLRHRDLTYPEFVIEAK